MRTRTEPLARPPTLAGARPPHSRAPAHRQRGRVSRALFAVLAAVGLVAAVVVLTDRASVGPVTTPDLPLVASGRAVSIDDGDTFVFVPTSPDGRDLRRYRVRLHGVDAPELLQSHGWTARSALAALLRDALVNVDCYKRDARGRAVCRVHVESERVGSGALDLELALLEAGHAWHYVAYAREQTALERERYAEAMARAQVARRGLWQEDAPLAPWQCRERLRAGQQCG